MAGGGRADEPSLLREIEARYKAQCRIQSAVIELTHRCPSRCIHCFLRPEPGGELSLAEVEGLLDALVDEGAVQLTFTGGEIFLRPDLPEILRAARKRGFFLLLLTTGVRIGPEEADLLKEVRPWIVGISLHGAVAETHDAILRQPGAFAKAVRAIGLLRERGIPVQAKTTILRANYRELGAIREMCERLDVRWSAGAAVLRSVDGGTGPISHALSEEELAEVDPAYDDPEFHVPEARDAAFGLICKAGRSVVGFSPYGDVYPCIVFPRSVGNIRERSLRSIWRDAPDPFLEDLRALRPEDFAGCQGCDLRAHCFRCPGAAYLEGAGLVEPSPTACKIAAWKARGRR
ncbi:MAG: radical SAM protein [Planctomycetes bacterium]|nr:radical SAM protein [Planctomycetota bacterium]